MNADDMKLMERLVKVAEGAFDGHLSILKFTTNWRVSFETPSRREDIDAMAVGVTFKEAALTLLNRIQFANPIR
ncbi:hypothetical protein A9174_25625 [Mesorhizobium loti NZP2037]|nr:hypothetical protein [Mesorhizobium loti]ANN59762.1 hypothetical protein A9174_25625 [Mesorhizobium loti NZP2037]